MPAWASAEIFPKWGSREEDYETSVSEIKSKRTFVKSCITQRKNIKNQSSTSLATILTVEVRLLTASPSDHDCFFPLMPLLQTATGVGAPYRQAHFLIIANQFQITMASVLATPCGCFLWNYQLGCCFHLRLTCSLWGQLHSYQSCLSKHTSVIKVWGNHLSI